MALPCFLAAMSVILISDLALSDFERPSGPPQSGRGVHGQYVYWIAMPAPSPEAISNSRLRSTEGMGREHFEETIRKAHVDSGVDVLETSTFIGPHADVKPHLNCLLRAQKQVRWKQRAETLFETYKLRVNCAPDIKCRADGLVYGRVASEHKGFESLHQKPHQWANSGQPTLLDDAQ